MGCFLSVASMLVAAPAFCDEILGKAHIVDGDTLEILEVPIRLNAVDAPEARQQCQDQQGVTWDCGAAATRALVKLIGTKSVRCKVTGRDKYHRILADCVTGGMNINAWMVGNGWALAFAKYDNKYVPEQQGAQSKRLGVWQGDFMLPWKWRDREATAAQSESGDCVIKGNINQRNERIYHMPWQQDYKKTKISQAKGERWFCTEQETLSAGWRRALR